MARKSYYDFQEKTAELESSKDYRAKNSDGFLGRYQFGVGALMDAGYYKGDKDGSIDNNRWDGAWTGKDGVYSEQDFLNNPKAQDNANREYNKKQWEYLMGEKLKQYIGKEINGVIITPARMLAGAHLVGHKKVAIYLKSDGMEIPEDGNGVPVEARMKEFKDDYDVSEITGIPHKDYIKERAARKSLLEKFPTKYSGDNAIEKMTPNEFRRNEKSINEELQARQKAIDEYNKEMKEYGKQKPAGSPTGGAAPVSNNPIASNKSSLNSPSKYINFNGISYGGKKWKDWNENEQRGFLEGFLGKSLDEVDKEINNKNKNNKKGHWTDKFNIGNPDKDKGHWVTLDNGKHLFIKDD